MKTKKLYILIGLVLVLAIFVAVEYIKIPKLESEEEIDKDTVLVKIETWGCTDFDKGKILKVRHGSFEIIEDECSAKFEKAFGATADCKTKLVSGDCVEGDTMHWTGSIVTVIRCPERFREEITEDSVLIETTIKGNEEMNCFYKGDILKFSHGSLKIIDECRQKHDRIYRGLRTTTTHNCYAKFIFGDCVEEDKWSWRSPATVVGAAFCTATIKKCPEKYKKEFNLEKYKKNITGTIPFAYIKADKSCSFFSGKILEFDNSTMLLMEMDYKKANKNYGVGMIINGKCGVGDEWHSMLVHIPEDYSPKCYGARIVECFNSSYDCSKIENKDIKCKCYAFLHQDLSYCEKITDRYDQFLEIVQNIKDCDKFSDTEWKDKCRLKFVNETTDISFCDSISTDHIRRQCITRIACFRKDHTICEMFDSRSYRQHCYSDVVERTKDAMVCKFITDYEARKVCVSNILSSTGYTGNVSVCDLLGTTQGKVCYSKFAKENDISICETAENEKIKGNCKYYFALELNDSSICENISDMRSADDCFFEFAKRKKDHSLCDGMNDKSYKNFCHAELEKL